jgi:hypothetical protein
MLSLLEDYFQEVHDEFDEQLGNDERLLVVLGEFSITYLFITDAETIVVINKIDSIFEMAEAVTKISSDLKELGLTPEIAVDEYATVTFSFNGVKRKLLYYNKGHTFFPDKLYKLVKGKTCITINNPQNEKYQKLFERSNSAFRICEASDISSSESSNLAVKVDVSYPLRFIDIARFVRCAVEKTPEIDSKCSECPTCKRIKIQNDFDLCMENNNIIIKETSYSLFRVK